MEKKQTFGDKSSKGKGSGKDHIKLIHSVISQNSGAIRFSEEMIRVPEDENADSFAKNQFSKK